MGTPHYPRDFGSEFNKLRRQAAAAYTSSNTRKAQNLVRAGSVFVDGGAIIVKDDDGSELAKLGDLGNGYRGTIINRAGGAPAFAIYGAGTGSLSGFVGLYDRSGDYIVTDDAASGRGLARPYIPLQIGDLTPPSAVTGNAAFTDIQAGAVVLQHPVLYAYMVIYASDATTAGEVRLALAGTAIGPVLTVPAGAFTYGEIGPFAIPDPGAYTAIRSLSVQARRTAGTGSVGARTLSLLGLESAYVQ